jgi:hypothetical protein
MPGGLGGIDMDVEAEVMRYLPRKKRDNELRSRLKVDGWGKLLGRILTARDDLEAELGRYFVLSNPTPGTGLSTIAALTGFTDLSPFILVKNEAPKESGERIKFRYLRLQNTVAGTAGASIRFAVKTDGENPKRYTSGASGIFNPKLNTTTPLNCVNVNQDDDTEPGIAAYAGPLVCTAASESARQMDSILIRPVIPVVGDEYLINFGGPCADVGSMATAGTAILTRPVQYHPVIIGPQQWAAFHIWLPSQSAASGWEFGLGFSKM